MTVALAIIAAAALSPVSTAPPPPWGRSASPDGIFSVETPCTPAELEKLRDAPESDAAGGVAIKRESRVLCMKDGTFIAAWDQTIGRTDKTAFDFLTSSNSGDQPAATKSSFTKINGHRAQVNREITESHTAQSVLVEVSETKLIFLMIGFLPASKASVSEQSEMIDRFTSSLKVAGR